MLHEFGLQLALKAHSKDIRTLEDVMVVFIHWRLLRYGFVCMGDGPSPNNVPTELLPLNLGWDGDLKGYFLKYQVKERQYLLSINLSICERSDAEVALLSDNKVTKVNIDISTLVWEDFLINMDSAESVAHTIDTDLIQAQGFRRVDEIWLSDWEDHRKTSADFADNEDKEAVKEQLAKDKKRRSMAEVATKVMGQDITVVFVETNDCCQPDPEAAAPIHRSRVGSSPGTVGTRRSPVY